MRLIPRLCLVLSLSPAVLAGCVDTRVSATTDRLTPLTHEAVLPYSFLSCSTEISASEQQRIRNWLGRLGLTKADTLVVSVPKNRLPSRDAARRRTLEQIFAPWPARLRFVFEDDLRELPRSEPRGIIRVVRVSEIRSHCPAGPGEPGCAGAANLAAMIAYPEDSFLPGRSQAYMPAAAEQATAQTAPASAAQTSGSGGQP